MSKNLVQKALCLLQENLETESSKKKKSKESSLNENKKKNQNKMPIKQDFHKKNKFLTKTYSDILKSNKSVDKTEENIYVLEQLSYLKPKKGVAEKVIQYYSKRKELSAGTPEEAEPQSILFDDSPKKNKKKKV